MALLSDRNNPNYAKSISESITALESLCKIILNNNSATLAKMLNNIHKKYELHQKFIDALKMIYSWTSDEDGLRHAGQKVPKVNHSEAKFMLVTCSAFINYLIDKSKS